MHFSTPFPMVMKLANNVSAFLGAVQIPRCPLEWIASIRS